MAVKGWEVGWPAAALVGTNKLPWEALGNVRELYLCLDLDVTGEGQKAARKLAREAVLRGVPVHIMEDGGYGGYSEPSDQWEAEGRVTLGRGPYFLGIIQGRNRPTGISHGSIQETPA